MNKIKSIYLKNEEIINYLVIGVLTTIVSFVTYFICVTFFLNPNNSMQLQIANVISWVCAVIFAYLTNRKFVFKSENKQIKKEISSFVSSRILTLIVDMIIMFVLVTLLNYNDKISKLIVQVVVTVLNYIFSKLFVFKK